LQRRLAAILAADVVGYSSLMEADEAGTLLVLSGLIKQHIEPLIGEHNGRIVKLMGDGILAEFASVVDAVNCAMNWQEMMTTNGSDLQFRIGINLGDIIHQDDDIFGNGVNVAARLEGLAEPGGVCVSETVYREVHKVLKLNGEDLGEQKVKNIADPVRAYRFQPQTQAVTAPPPVADSLSGSTTRGRDKPSIAILPFSNMSGDPEQEFFSDGMTEDIITGLSRFRTLFVLARNSSFSLKGQNLDSKEIGRRLGVQYLVEGSVRKAGNRVRISAQLVEAETGNQIWAERFDRDLEDIFAVQDEVTSAIVAVLPGRVQHNVADRTARQPTSSLKAYELLLQGKALRDGLNAQDTARARKLLEKALELDPGYARVYMYLADTYVVDIWLGLAEDQARNLSLELARKGAALDNKDVYIQDQLGYAFLCAGLWKDAEVQFDKTLSNIVNEAESMAWCGYGFLLLGAHEKAYEVVVEARRLDPLHPPALDWIYGQIFFFAGRYDEVVNLLIGEALLNSLAHVFLVAAYAHAGREAEAQQALKAFIEKRREEFSSRGLPINEETIESLAGGFKFMWRREEDWLLLADGLRKAGLS
jgi:TolB-like protein/class 3 adenylate cyclase/Tfp pilus assembly protein PilF